MRFDCRSCLSLSRVGRPTHFICTISPTAHSWKPIVENIEARFDAYLEQENRVNRAKLADNRVHACLYFIQPTGHA